MAAALLKNRDDFIKLRCVGQDGSEIHYGLSTSTPLKLVKELYAERKGQAIDAFIFLFSNVRVTDESTPMSMGMEDNDVIEVIVVVGGPPGGKVEQALQPEVAPVESDHEREDHAESFEDVKEEVFFSASESEEEDDSFSDFEEIFQPKLNQGTIEYDSDGWPTDLNAVNNVTIPADPSISLYASDFDNHVIYAAQRKDELARLEKEVAQLEEKVALLDRIRASNAWSCGIEEDFKPLETADVDEDSEWENDPWDTESLAEREAAQVEDSEDESEVDSEDENYYGSEFDDEYSEAETDVVDDDYESGESVVLETREVCVSSSFDILSDEEESESESVQNEGEQGDFEELADIAGTLRKIIAENSGEISEISEIVDEIPEEGYFQAAITEPQQQQNVVASVPVVVQAADDSEAETEVFETLYEPSQSMQPCLESREISAWARQTTIKLNESARAAGASGGNVQGAINVPQQQNLQILVPRVPLWMQTDDAEFEVNIERLRMSRQTARTTVLYNMHQCHEIESIDVMVRTARIVVAGAEFMTKLTKGLNKLNERETQAHHAVVQSIPLADEAKSAQKDNNSNNQWSDYQI